MSREIMQQALDALEYHTMQTRPINHTDKAIEALKQELAKPEPQVCCGDYEKCWKACTPRGRWLAEKELAHLEQVDYEKLTAKFGEQAKEYLVAAKKNWEPESHIVKWSIPVDPNNFGEPLAQPEQAEKQEPAAWMYKGNFHDFDPSEWASPEFAVTPLYTAPPRKEWVGLTEHEIWECQKPGLSDDVYKLIEAKLRERNT